ncbi:MAG: imidazole glycerol phosphate synthase subunit HisH [Kangiellaceae bacterium]|nr:imidazole glycerol phosphate synthase subunit HisH [Kangiellaceae bacterium]MCW8997814.1 imidazole glycerol phosphate synthase subunit HisH [Kangiellaceae bacterium]MCW9015618.1 imidazole glycerol phosphate synthase subunit HisH [Kangiellaceae bacterium]
MTKILIVDTKAGNLFSLRAAIERLDLAVEIKDKPPADKYGAIVIPGQGRFGTVLSNLRKNNWVPFLEEARQKRIPMLGICVGMQIFFEASDEDPDAAGFGWFKGKAERLDFPKKPMVGWADLETINSARNWPKEPVYFVNSFAVKNSDKSIATTIYGERFCAAIQQGSFTGVQFHPEKSAQCGSEIIRQSLTITGELA